MCSQLACVLRSFTTRSAYPFCDISPAHVLQRVTPALTFLLKHHNLGRDFWMPTLVAREATMVQGKDNPPPGSCTPTCLRTDAAPWKSNCSEAWPSPFPEVYMNRMPWSYKHRNPCCRLFPFNLTASLEMDGLKQAVCRDCFLSHKMEELHLPWTF